METHGPPTFSLSGWCGPTLTPWHEEAVVEVTCSGLGTNPGCDRFLLALMALSLSSQPHGFRKGPLSTLAAAGSGKAKIVLHEILHSLWSWPCLTGQCCAFARAAPVQLQGSVPQRPGELQAEEPLCSLGSCHEAGMGNARDRDNRGYQLVSDLCSVFSPAYLYSS